MIDAIDLAVFSSRLAAICDEMGAVLRQSAFSPNIRDRLDFSCAIFDAQGSLCAQAAHIPVHLGSMAFAMQDIVAAWAWRSGDMVVLNDPFLGGTHLPDVTVIAPLFVAGEVVAFLVNRAHHASIGGSSPGSMPIATRLEDEGVVMPPTLLVNQSVMQVGVMARLAGREEAAAGVAADPALGDFAAQVSANRAGLERLSALVSALGAGGFRQRLDALDAYAERLAREALRAIPAGRYCFGDVLDDDGQGQHDIPIRVAVEVDAARGDVTVDFTGTAAQVAGNVNCPLSVAAAAVFYVFRCLMPAQTPACAGAFRPLHLRADDGSLVNAQRPAAVAAGNVETSSRIVDAVLGALAQALPARIPAASQGSMNNFAMGAVTASGRWDYYETMGGGMGAHAGGNGLSAVQTHMTNTLNTPAEVLESHFPVRVRRYAVRRGSGGSGRFRGGDGLVRAYEFLVPAQFTLLTERRTRSPWGAAGGGDGAPGVNTLNSEVLPGKCSRAVEAGDVLEIATPGGGGFGSL
jgi:N-methylhydantoinase B